MNYILIRTFDHDEYLARLCYESFKAKNVQGKYIFLAQRGGVYESLLRTGEELLTREACANFGGQEGARKLLDSLRPLRSLIKEEDTVIISDSDIVLLTDFTPQIEGADHFGTGGIVPKPMHDLCHISGQMQVLSGAFFHRLINVDDHEAQKLVIDVIHRGHEIADDTFISYLSDAWGLKKKVVNASNLWLHYKYHSYKGTEPGEAYKEIQKQYSNIIFKNY